jgi:hypothetical protein
MDRDKKIAAAISGVMAYLQEEEAALAAAQLAAAPAIKTAMGPPPGLWGPSGRQSQMQLRNLMQLRAFHR